MAFKNNKKPDVKLSKRKRKNIGATKNWEHKIELTKKMVN